MTPIGLPPPVEPFQHRRMKQHKRVAALLREAESEGRCAIGDGGALYHALRRRVGALELESPYPNLFADVEYWRGLDPEERSLHVIRALARLHPRWMFAGLSAACVYGYQHAHALHDGTVYVASVHGPRNSDARRLKRIYVRPNTSRYRYRNIIVTSPAQTLIDCAVHPFANALAIYDSALRTNHVTIEDVRTLMIRVPCDETAVGRLVRHADARSENGGESLARGRIIESGFASPDLQVEFDNPDNPLMPYRVDFCWRLYDGRIIVAEYDGMAKYRDAGNPNRASLQAKLEYERRREVSLKAQGVTTVVHLFFEDVIHAGRLEPKLTAAGVPRIR